MAESTSAEGVVGNADGRPGVYGTSNASSGVYGQTNGNGAIYGSDFNANGITDGQEYDRTIPNSAKPYRSGPPSGAVQIGDAIVALNQVGANCTAPPP